ncbi:YibE/F-like protein [Nocardioides dokdonensis FR1436]|uniref:YibE/F-like protein n=1 Tax=Nocardioides dokdonensis FR1436 TaxID=1300347 RepID=A0A1A9GIX2_9ACTN|nr:YibE/F family protein [Nocardioides dokdonensis]ANH38026.1 YibE/F-like protein [Nocardioides dokdonensis FR1436]
MGGHHRRPGRDELVRTPRAAWLVLAPIALLTLAAMVWLWPTEDLSPPEGQSGVAQYQGSISAIERTECTEELSDDVNGCGTATVALEVPEDDPRENPVETADVPLPNGPGAPEVDEGDDVVLILNETPDGESYAIVDHQRGTGLVLLVGAFVLAMVAFGRWRGVSALAGLGVTFVLLLYFVVPAILAGSPPLLVAIVGSAAIMLTVLYLTHGLAATTTVAVLGTLASLTLTGLLSALAVSALHLTGVTDDLSLAVGTTQGVNTQGLLLAGIVIGSLGVLDDVTVTQAATVAELARANPAYGARQLFVAGSRVGRSHIASVVNTIVLAYAGSALPLLILIVANTESFGGVVTDQIIAQEVVRSVVATLGLVAAVPLTTGLAAVVLRAHPRTVSGRPSQGSTVA